MALLRYHGRERASSVKTTRLYSASNENREPLAIQSARLFLPTDQMIFRSVWSQRVLLVIDDPCEADRLERGFCRIVLLLCSALPLSHPFLASDGLAAVFVLAVFGGGFPAADGIASATVRADEYLKAEGVLDGCLRKPAVAVTQA